MKSNNKKHSSKMKNKSAATWKINIVIVIVVFAAGFSGVLADSVSFMDALDQVFQKMMACLEHKADHILEIVVIIILALTKGIAGRFGE